MFQLIWLLFCLPFYILSITVGIGIYLFILIIKLIKIVIKAFFKSVKSQKKYEKAIRKKNIKETNYLDTSKVNNNFYYNVENYNEKLNYYNKKRNKDFILSQVTDTELKVTVEKIQELYNELGFKVKVIDIIKKKYITEYEVIFSRKITQSDILSVSNKIIEEFQIDGVKIVRNLQKENRIYIQIPLKYEETLT